MKKLLLIFLLIAGSVYSQNYELYTGSAISIDKEITNPGYLIGANFIIKTNQNREYLNNLILGFETSGMIGNKISIFQESIEPIKSDCNCTTENIGFENTNYNYRKEIFGYSLNIGVEINKRWYIISGFTNYDHILFINGIKTIKYRTNRMDISLKYFIKTKNSFITSTIKYNPESISLGIGYSR